MMKMSEIFEALTYGELSQVALGGPNTGEITEANYRHVGNHVKLGLTKLYSRFDLKRNSLVLQLTPTIEVYKLMSRYAVSNTRSLELTRWINDTVEQPFLDDIVKICGIYTDKDCEIKLNEYSNDWSVTTPTMDSLRVPHTLLYPNTDTPKWLITPTLKVEYQANHPDVIPRVGFFDPELTEVELPDIYLQALLYFVASRVANPIGMGQEFNAGNNWAAKFEQECLRLEADGLQVDRDTDDVHGFRRNGWV